MASLDHRGLPDGYRFQDDWEVAPRQVRKMMDDGDDFVLLDCRTPQEHEIGRIEGAKLVPLQELQSRLIELEAYEDKPIVVYCHHGGRSLQMTALLRQAGFEDVRSMAGGIDLWSVDVDPRVPRY